MALWKKVVIGLFGAFALLVATAIGSFLLLGASSSDMCADTLLSETPSPNGKLKAVLFQIDCGATSGFDSHVAIMPIKSSLSNESQGAFENRSFFTADTNHDKAPIDEGGGTEVRLNWASNDKLDIQYHELARVIRAEKTSKGVSVVYHTFH